MTNGPTKTTTLYCNSCNFLQKEDWIYYDENDYEDSGTRASCLKQNKIITNNFYSKTVTPIWCPYTNATKRS